MLLFSSITSIVDAINSRSNVVLMEDLTVTGLIAQTNLGCMKSI